MKANDASTLGKAIKDRRKKLGLKQKDVADATGFSVSFISDLENGKPTAELGKSIHIINMLGMDLNVDARE
ncbi:MAG: helix-turn-helix transcriptional regulator [Eubacterium sp.]|nr:helix-turn-helix transcriptional regulator [Eubacterium sp.]